MANSLLLLSLVFIIGIKVILGFAYVVAWFISRQMTSYDVSYFLVPFNRMFKVAFRLVIFMKYSSSSFHKT